MQIGAFFLGVTRIAIKSRAEETGLSVSFYAKRLGPDLITDSGSGREGLR